MSLIEIVPLMLLCFCHITILKDFSDLLFQKLIPSMGLDIEKYRGKYRSRSGDEILYFDWRLKKENVYEISG